MSDQDLGVTSPAPLGSGAKKGGHPQPARGEAWGILNPYGDLWTYNHFRTEEAARQYVHDFWRGLRTAYDVSEFRIVRVKVTVSAVKTTRTTPESSNPPEGDR